ncbi:NAD(P)/FAD-dependent oxidoreductase [Aquabacterium sp.]|uniref:NAD(P)/FAD-dependent oxidoreductase n=1 Tax=Aquabacterium sp. TaxID=1872578 RepID=UPI002C81764E|nr:FAD-binding oxidoreductase [Aquabacterium sp.]HSW09164.1 FAD-binding oxidoreductase [Aquabacterium sp.]
MTFLSADRELTRHSYYADTAVREARYPALEGDASCDVAIVGGGLAGLSAAIELAQRGFSVRVLEARQVGAGASGRNGGQAIHGLACDIGEIESQLGLDEAKRIFGMSIEALDLIRSRCQRFNIDADWRDGYLGVAVNARKGRELLEGAERLASIYSYPMTPIAQADLPQWINSPRYVAAVHDPRSGHLHPLKYTLGLARAAGGLGVRIHEGTPVIGLTPSTRPVLHTATGRIIAGQVLLAGNVYLQGIAPQLESRIMPVGTYIVATEPVGPALARQLIPSLSAVCDNNFVLDYFRFSADSSLLYGGRVSYSTTTPANLAESMRQRLVQTFPQLAATTISHAWGGFVDISMNRAPDFGRLAASPQVYYLQGFSGHGLALTGLAGQLVAEAMNGDATRFDTFARIRHKPFPGGRMLRTPALVLGMAWYRMKDALS